MNAQQRTATLKVEPTDAGDNRYFVVTRRSDGTKFVDAKLFRELTPNQKRMLSVPSPVQGSCNPAPSPHAVAA